MQEHRIASRDDSSRERWKLFFSIFIKTTALSFVFVFIFLLITAGALGLIALAKLSKFESLAQTNRQELFGMIKQGWNTSPKQVDNRITILVLGVDAVANRGNTQVLTDTMLLTTIHLDSGEIHLLPIPRDLWSAEYKTKVNALYAYGEDRYPGKPEQFSTEVIQTMTDVPIQHTLVISLDTLGTLIDTIGGVPVTVPTGFKDELFPRSDVDVTTETDPSKLYKTIEFSAGEQIMSGETALEYIRSRHSDDEEGSDNARSARQQLVIRSLIQKLISPETLKSPETLANLYALYQTKFNQFIPLTELISIAKQLLPVRNSISFYNETVSLFPDSQTGAIFHPPVNQYDNQWVYAVKDEQLFKQEIQIKLLQNEANQLEYKEI